MKVDLPASNLSACIHRGANQIGGSCVELAYDGARLLLDLGKPLDVDEADKRLLPPVKGLVSGSESSLVGIVISHGHIDHWGLLPLVKGDVRIAMGAATRRILQAAKPFVPSSFSPDQTIDLANERAIKLGPFTIEPRLVDHSAFDAYALTVQAGNRRVFYSGDLRGHGRKARLFQRLLRSPPRARQMSVVMPSCSSGPPCGQTLIGLACGQARRRFRHNGRVTWKKSGVRN